MQWPEPEHRAVLLDPCAGDGTAIRTLRDLWAERSGLQSPQKDYYRWPWVTACELEEERAMQLRWGKTTTGCDVTFHADCFRLYPDSRSSGATVLYLNPPYDTDPEFGRLEQRFLARFTDHLAPGHGALLFLVPGPALEASAEFLARHYLDLRAWRLPDPDYEAYRQVLVVGRRAAAPLAGTGVTSRIRGWASAPEVLPILPEVCPEPLVLDLSESFSLSYQVQPIDIAAALATFDPWSDAPVGSHISVHALLGQRFRTAMPPKPALLALAVSAGMVNGCRLVPNDRSSGRPEILAKGTLSRQSVEISEKTDKKGARTGAIAVEVPRLELTLLRLDDGSFHTLSPGLLPTESLDPSDWNAADLIHSYDRSLTQQLGRQFPPLHNPADPSARIELPKLCRSPYTIQSHAIQTALKLLASGKNPFLIGEVGCGKTTMAVYVAAALSPAHWLQTSAQLSPFLARGEKVPLVRRTLVVCPPHLLSSWRSQIAAVLPEATVRIIETFADLEEPAEFSILSRETAKLGHAVGGTRGACPRCGAAVEAPPEARASRRLRCQALRRQPGNLCARLAVDLASFLATTCPEEALVEDLAPYGLRKLVLDRGARDSVTPSRLADIVQRILGGIDLLRAEHSSALYSLISGLPSLARLAGISEHARQALQAMLPKESGTSTSQTGYGPTSWIRTAITALDAGTQEESEDSPVDSIPGLFRWLETLHEHARWIDDGFCNEPLFQAVPDPRRYPLALWIARYHRRTFDFIVLDEAHEFADGSSAQSKAAYRLTGLPHVATLVLTGSLMGGYASSLFPIFWALSPDFREEFLRTEVGAFVARYGFRKLLIQTEDRGSEPKGRMTDRELRKATVISEAPGILPTFLMRYLLPVAIFVHKSDLDTELPPCHEVPVPIHADPELPRDAELLAEYRRLQNALVSRIRREGVGRSSKLLGALVELPSYLDRATEDLGEFVLREPEDLGGGVIAEGKLFPSIWRTPKERWLFALLRERLAQGDRAIVFLRHTGSELPRRLLRVLGELTPRIAWLDAKKVPTAKREAWIDQNVIAKKVEILLVNPNAVRTGLNNLVGFNLAIWHELDYSATTYRQACGRLHRIGQTRPVTIYLPYYQATAQEIAFELIAKKVSASLLVDGLDLQAALEAAGAAPEKTAAIASAMSLGRAVYERLVGRS